MKKEVIIAGAGGQGIMLLGKILATAAMRENKFVSWLPSYGAEVRGGTAHCMLVISDKEIGSPYVEKADILLVLNEPSLEKFKNRTYKRGLLIINSSLVPRYNHSGITIVQMPFTERAEALGNIKVANIVALGCLLSRDSLVAIKTMEKVIRDFAPAGKKELISTNIAALREGASLK
ncbi:MAG: 2-oxoacid:acceptor oxidoreductase family protein [Candidatus Omnitrophota bacterium]